MLPKIPKPNCDRKSVFSWLQDGLVGLIKNSKLKIKNEEEELSKNSKSKIKNEEETVNNVGLKSGDNKSGRQGYSLAQKDLSNGGEFTSSIEFEKVCHAVNNGHSVLVLGEYGSGINGFADALLGEMAEDFNCAIASYKGSLKKFLVSLAEALDIPTSEPKYNNNGDEVGEKALTADGLKEEIACNVGDETLLIIPDSQRLPASLRYWLEGLLDNGINLVMFAVANPRRDVFLRLLEVELSLPSDLEIREVMRKEARRLGLSLSRSELANLQSQAGRNQMLARKVIRATALGINNKKPEHSQYLDISPIIISGLMALGIVRFIGMGTGNKGLYIVGGVALILGLIFKQLGQVKGAKKRLGQ